MIRLLLALVLAAPNGHYLGTWASDAGATSGKVTLTLTGSSEGAMQSNLTFSYQNQEIKPAKVTTKIDGDQVEVICNIELDGYKLQTKFTGTSDGKQIVGQYHTVSAEDGSAVDSGTWKVALQP